jgi:hypothetical protein
MTPKEKAEKLVKNYINVVPQDFGGMDKDLAKQCALIAVDEILNLEPPELSYLEPFSNSWWSEVKQEIEKL